MNSYKRRLFIVFNRAMSKAKKQDAEWKQKLIDRLKKAFSILQYREYYIEEKALYQPTTTSCHCKDFEFHYSKKRKYKFHCKHMIAEILLERIQALTYQQTNFFDLMEKR